VYLALAGINLTAQGPYYDELHQAPAAFVYIGRSPPFFALIRVGGVPMMTMPYSSAIKSGLYGLYLQATGQPFSLLSWRCVGLGIVMAGILSLTWMVRRRVNAAVLGLLLLLLVSDGTVILCTRHDWGPVALALYFRLLMIGLFLRGLTGPISHLNSFFIGTLAGLAVFEKLSSVALIPALAVVFLADPSRRSWQHRFACLKGGIAGCIPLLLVNAVHYHNKGQVLSLSRVANERHRSLGDFFGFLGNYVSVSGGDRPAAFILGLDRGFDWINGLLIVLCLVTILAWGIRRTTKPARLAVGFSVAFFVVGISLYLIPNNTWVHHWILGAPFQYAAIATALYGMWQQPPTPLSRALGATLIAGCVVLLGARAVGLAQIERALIAGRTSSLWDPSLGKLAEFAASRPPNTVFIAGTWGTAVPWYCYANGRPGLVLEAYWYYWNGDGESLPSLLGKLKSDTIYFVLRAPLHLEETGQIIPGSDWYGEDTGYGRIITDLDNCPGLREVPVETEVADLPTVRVRKFIVQH